MRKLSSVLSRRVVRFLGENAKKDPAEYLKFFAEFGQFIKVTLLVLEFGQFIKAGA